MASWLANFGKSIGYSAKDVLTEVAPNTTKITEDAADEIYKNPFASSDSEGAALGHDTIINHIVKIEICPKAKQMLNMLAMNMMGIGGF